MLSPKNQTVLLSILCFYIIALPLILLDYNAGRAFIDQDFGHLPAIMAFCEQVDFSDYRSATTPGYHLLIAFFAKFFSPDPVFLKLVSSLITALFIGVLAGLLFDRAGRLKTTVLLLPMTLSLYILPDGVWLVPDNLAWLTVALLFIFTARHPLDMRYFCSTGLVLLLAVFVRQSNLWLAAIPWAAGLSNLLYNSSTREERWRLLTMAILITIPAFLLLLYFFSLWGGLVPPTVQGRHERTLSFCVPAFFFSLFLVYGGFYTPVVMSGLKKVCTKHHFWYIAMGCFLGFVVAVIPATDYNYEVGRFSGFWNFVRMAPTIGQTSVLLTITSTLGGALFFAWLLLIKKEFRFILLLATLAFVLALIPNSLVLERYFAGYLFILIFIMLSHSDEITWDGLPRTALMGPAVFALINFLFLYRGLFHAS